MPQPRVIDGKVVKSGQKLSLDCPDVPPVPSNCADWCEFLLDWPFVVNVHIFFDNCFEFDTPAERNPDFPNTCKFFISGSGYPFTECQLPDGRIMQLVHSGSDVEGIECGTFPARAIVTIAVAVEGQAELGFMHFHKPIFVGEIDAYAGLYGDAILIPHSGPTLQLPNYTAFVS